jgi:hypothetical protein
MMNHKELQAIAQAAAKGIKTQEDLKEFQQMLTKKASTSLHSHG